MKTKYWHITIHWPNLWVAKNTSEREQEIQGRYKVPRCKLLTFSPLKPHNIWATCSGIPFYLCQVYRYLPKLFWVSLSDTPCRNKEPHFSGKSVTNYFTLYQADCSADIYKKITTEQDIKYLTYDIICPRLVLNKHQETCNDNPCLRNKTSNQPIQRYMAYGSVWNKCALSNNPFLQLLQVGPIPTMTAPLHFTNHKLPPQVNFISLRKKNSGDSNGSSIPLSSFFGHVVIHQKMAESNRDCLHNTPWPLSDHIFKSPFINNI